MLFRFMMILLFLVAFYQPDLIQAASANNQKSDQSSNARIISKSTAINAAKRKVNGKVLSASLIKSKGPAVYRVKMLISDSGRVRTVFVDGETGRVINVN